MESMLEFAQGPLFRFALLFMLLGLARHLTLSLVGFVRASRRAGGAALPIASTFRESVAHANPVRYVFRTRGFYTVLTVTLHVGLLAVPLFQAGHLVLLERSLGVGWPHLPVPVADGFTLLTVAVVAAVILSRLLDPGSRRISRVQDWALPLLIGLVFLTGYFTAHPRVDLLPHPGSRLVHVLGADLLMVLIPTTKLSHMVLLPFSRAVAELGWRLVPGSGERVRRSLGKEGQPI